MKSSGRTPAPTNRLGSQAFWRPWVSDLSARVLGAILMGGALALHMPWPWSFLEAGGLVLVSLAASFLVHIHLRQISKSTSSVDKHERIVYATAILAILGGQAIRAVLGSESHVGTEYLQLGPIVAQAMLVSALIGPSAALLGLSFTALLMGLSGMISIELVTASWIAGVVGAHAVNPMKQRSHLLRAVSIQSGANVIIALSLGIVAGVTLAQMTVGTLWAVVAAFIATSVFWLGLALFERVFDLVSDWTLLELCSPEHPLLHDLALRAPGTYAHSIGVANLAEAAARKVGANPVLVRTMAYFHDVGKTVRPAYFIENQTGENPHDHMSPALSAQVLTAHVRDGVELGKQKKLPGIILDAIRQHHGTSLITYFYHRATTGSDVPEPQLDEQPCLEKFFRYDGPVPQTREIAILHLADQVEAATRTCRNQEECERMIQDIVERSRADGQLNECDLTFRDVSLIAESFTHTVNALRHDRIEYPDTAVVEELSNDSPIEPLTESAER
ncbi:MAG: HDIG domain-containing protein [Fimbriimonadaceae bacterium]|nr:HDIG domain-containing protein [Fimbriimonadaceae bacterium]